MQDDTPRETPEPTVRRVYQATVYFGDRLGQNETLYGESPEELRHAVSTWVQEHEPTSFSANPHSEYHLREEYGYSDGTRSPGLHGKAALEEGWYWFPAGKYNPDPKKLDSLTSAAKSFASSISPHPGPDYVHVPLVVDGQMRHDLIKRVRASDKISEVNDLLQRGWTIIAIDMSGNVSERGEIVRRVSTYILGHSEQHMS